ncbi:hypothetical protein M9Y10_043639, partial [Tritrichomonas musculus]
ETYTFITKGIYQRNIYGSQMLVKFDISPDFSPIWDFKTLSIFINEMIDYEPAKIKPIRNVTIQNTKYIEMKFIHRIVGDYIIIYFNTERNFEISVTVGRKILFSNGWNEKIETPFIFSYRITYFPLSLGSEAIANTKPFAFLNSTDFCQCFYFYARNIIKKIPKNRFTSFLFEFSEIFILRPNFNSIFNIEQLKQKNQGYLRFYVTNIKNPGLYQLDENSFVLRGAYISPFAKSILETENFLNGIQIDGTFKVINKYVTCIVLGIAYNTGIPLGFCFSKFEDENLFNSIFEIFNEIVGVDLSKFTIQSDKGKAIESSCTKYGCTHIYCLKHLITSFKNKKFSFEVSQLMKCQCQKDYDNLVDIFTPIFRSIKKQVDKNRLEKVLNKVGLTFSTGNISILNQHVFDSNSMLKRSFYKMPSTTNQIESKHGHLNDLTPRNNTFFGAIKRLILSITTQIHQFNRNMFHNYRRVINQIKNDSKIQRIDEKCQYYNATQHSCECGENNLYSAMFRLNIPCSHMVHLGAEFEKLEEIEIDLKSQFDELIPDIIPDETENNFTHVGILKTIAIKNIKRFSHSKQKDEIAKYFDDHFHSEFKKFALGYPIEFFTVVSEGIEFFSSK